MLQIATGNFPGLKAGGMLLVCAFLSGCFGINLDIGFDEDQQIKNQIISQTEDLYADIDPLYINDDVKALIDAHISPRDDKETRVDVLQKLLFGEDFINLRYADEKTHTALEAFYARSGNCLSAMNLYVAMARYAGVEAHYQTVDIQPSWDRRGGLLVLSQHINATGRLSVRRRYIVDFTPEVVLQQLTSSVISDEEARALYFNNLGVEELIKGDNEAALKYFKNSLFLDDQSSIAWNNIGTTYSRLDNSRFSEYSYRRAFDLDQTNATAINNLAKYYRRSGNARLAREYEQAIEKFNNVNPYYHFSQGNIALQEFDLDTARSAFRRALRIKQEEPEFYFALARVYLSMGNTREAQKLVDSGNEILAKNGEIYQPSSHKVRIIDAATILRETSPGMSIIAPGGRPSGTSH